MKNNKIPENTNASVPGTAPRCPTCGFVPCRCPGGGGGSDDDPFDDKQEESIGTRDNSAQSKSKGIESGVTGISVLASKATLFTKNLGGTPQPKPDAKKTGDQTLTGATPIIANGDEPQDKANSKSSIPSPFATPTYTLSKK